MGRVYIDDREYSCPEQKITHKRDTQKNTVVIWKAQAYSHTMYMSTMWMRRSHVPSHSLI